MYGVKTYIQNLKGRDGSEAIALRGAGGVFEAHDGLIWRTTTETQVWESALNEVKAKRMAVYEIVQEAIP